MDKLNEGMERSDDAVAEGSMPSFLEGHRALGTTPTEQTPPSPNEDGDALETQGAKETRDDKKGLGGLFAEGVESVRAVGAARKAHSKARSELEALKRAIAESEAELEHRRDVISRHNQIVEEQGRELEDAIETQRRAKDAASEFESEVARLKSQLEAMKEADVVNERRLKSARDAAEASETSARESGARLQRRVDDAKRNLERAKKEREEGLTAAGASIDAARAHLATLRAEYTEIQKNPSANPAGYTVRMAELDTEISDAAEALRRAQGELPVVDRETQQAIDTASRMLDEAERPISAAKKSFDEVVAAADRARDAYDDARRDSESRQKELRRSISEREKALREWEREGDDAQARAHAAQAAIDEANDIQAHPEITEELAAQLETDRIRRASLADEVERRAEHERDVRDETRPSRARLTIALVTIFAVIAVAIACLFALGK